MIPDPCIGRRSLGVSIVIPAYNAETSIGDLLAEVCRQADGIADILVVDDGSTDRTAERVLESGVRCVRQINAGPANARNVGAGMAVGEVLVFLDSDLVPAPDALKRMLAPFADLRVDAVQGVYKSRQSSLLAQYCQAEIDYKQRRCIRHVFIDSINAAVFAIRKSVFEEYGGFHAGFRMAAAEDTDLGFRMARNGRRILFCPDVLAYHPQPEKLLIYLRLKFWRGY